MLQQACQDDTTIIYLLQYLAEGGQGEVNPVIYVAVGADESLNEEKWERHPSASDNVMRLQRGNKGNMVCSACQISFQGNC